MQPAAQFRLLSNRSPEKYGLQQLKRANAGSRFTPWGLWLQTNIQNDFGRNIGRIMTLICGRFIP